MVKFTKVLKVVRLVLQRLGMCRKLSNPIDIFRKLSKSLFDSFRKLPRDIDRIR
jgi:hypothetical protein